MTHAKEYKPFINELVDLMNQQKSASAALLEKTRADGSDAKFAEAVQSYIKTFDAQDDALMKVARMMQISIEKEDFSNLVRHK